MTLPAKIDRTINNKSAMPRLHAVNQSDIDAEARKREARREVNDMVRNAVMDAMDSRDAQDERGLYRFNIFDPANAKMRRTVGTLVSAFVGIIGFIIAYQVALANIGAFGMLLIASSLAATVYFKVIKTRNVMWYQTMSNITKRPVEALDATRATNRDLVVLKKNYRTIGDILNGGREQFQTKGFSKKLLADLDVMFEDLGYARIWEE